MKAITCFSRHATARLQPRGLRRRSQIVQQVLCSSGTGKSLVHTLGFPYNVICLQEGPTKARVQHVELLQKGINAERAAGLKNVAGLTQHFSTFHVSSVATNSCSSSTALHHMMRM